MAFEKHDDYDRQLKDGQKYEDFVADTLYEHGIPIWVYRSHEYQMKRGESRAGLEIKYDRRHAETGNLFIETAERPHESKEFRAAGIYHRDENWLYAIGDYDVIYMFATTTLQKLDRQESQSGELCRDHVCTNTSKGFLISKDQAEYEANRREKDTTFERRPSWLPAL